MEYKYLEPEQKKAVDHSKGTNIIIVTMIDGFITDREALILRDFLWYARDNGVEVRFIPPKVNQIINEKPTPETILN